MTECHYIKALLSFFYPSNIGWGRPGIRLGYISYFCPFIYLSAKQQSKINKPKAGKNKITNIRLLFDLIFIHVKA
jgi:hypothetical protein